jgi:adenylylsulfate reductase, subunit A
MSYKACKKLKKYPMSIRDQFQSEEIQTDLLILGGGMSACGAAYEAAHWAKQHNMTVALVDKASMDRSGAVAMGLSAINLYLGLKNKENSLEDYLKYVKKDLMGITRDDLVFNIARHVDSSVHLFEKWGLPIWKDEKGFYLREGRWQIMIHGESYKTIVAEAAKKSLEELGEKGRYFERVFITDPLVENNRICGAIGFSVREKKIYIFRAKAVITAMGGAVHVYKPRSVGEGLGRSWYPPFNSGASAYFTIQSGAEMTCQEVRFVPVRFKDAYGPVGAWYLLFKAESRNAAGENYLEKNKAELEKWLPYAHGNPLPTNLRNYLMLIDERKGLGPFYMHTADAIQKIAEEETDEPNRKRKLKLLENEAWEDFLDMTISQALLWASTDIHPEEKNSEIGATEPYFISSHSGASGAWLSGPRDMAPEPYQWGYPNMTTVEGLFACGDASGASSHKFSSGSFTEGRIAGKSAVDFIFDHETFGEMDSDHLEVLKQKITAPLELFEKHQGHSTDKEVSPFYIKPKMFMFRLQKIMDEYAAGAGASFMTSKKMLEKGLEFLHFMHQDAEKLAAEDLHELMRCWENKHRLMQAEAHIRALIFREETRWPGYYIRSDFPEMNQEKWKCFVNSKYDPVNKSWEMMKKEMIELVQL